MTTSKWRRVTRAKPCPKCGGPDWLGPLPTGECVPKTIADLAAAGLTPADVRQRCPWATEYVALDGGPCWRVEELAPLLAGIEDQR